MHTTASSTLGGCRFQEETRPAKDKLERCSPEGCTKNGMQLGRVGGIRTQQMKVTMDMDVGVNFTVANVGH